MIHMKYQVFFVDLKKDTAFSLQIIVCYIINQMFLLMCYQ